MNLYKHDNSSIRQQLKEAIDELKTELKEKEQRERGIEDEENRLREEAENSTGIRYKNIDEKEYACMLGANILWKIKDLEQDQLIIEAWKYAENGWCDFIPIHEREITDSAEIFPDMPKDRSVRELFQLTSSGTLTYVQIYGALHFAEGILQTIQRRDPIRFGFKLENPADFRKLGISSVKAFLEALNDGEPYRISIERIARLRDELKTERGEEKNC